MVQFRRITKQDVEHIHELHLLPETDRYNTSGIPESLEETKAVVAAWFLEIEKDKKHVFIIENEAGNFVGIIGMNIGKPNYLRAEIWYKIQPQHWRKGVASAAVNMILQFGFIELKLHRIEAGCATENIGSVKVLEKCGFTNEGISRKNLPIRGEWKDNYNFGILENEWLQFQKS